MEDKSDNGELDLDGIEEEEIEKVCSLINVCLDKLLYSLDLHCFFCGKNIHLLKSKFCHKMLLDLCLC